MADQQTPAEIAAEYIENVETRALLEQDIIDWYNWKILGIKTVFKDVILAMEIPTTEILLDAVDALEISEEEES